MDREAEDEVSHKPERGGWADLKGGDTPEKPRGGQVDCHGDGWV